MFCPWDRGECTPVRNTPTCLKVTMHLIASVKCVLVQTRKKAPNAGLMRELLLCSLTYSAGARVRGVIIVPPDLAC